MALGANTYGTVARVEARIGDLVSSRKFTDGPDTTPSLAEVEAILDDVAAEIDAELKIANYSVPVKEADDAEAFVFLRKANSAGASAVILNMFPGTAFDPNDESPGTSRKNGLWAEFNRVIKMIREGRLPAARTADRTDRFFSGSREDKDGNVKRPLFTRDLHDVKGSRSLTE